MNAGQFSVWYFADSNEVLLTDDNSPPVGAALVGLYDRPEFIGWGEAGEAAKKKAAETGALIIYSAMFA